MPREESSAPLLLNDKGVARLLSMSESWVRSQRFKRHNGDDHVFDVTPHYIGTSVRYRHDEIVDWFNRLAPPNREAANDNMEEVNDDPPWEDDNQPTQPTSQEGSKEPKTSPRRRAIPIPITGCRHIIADPKIDPTNCGKTRKDGSPYCEEHHAICHVDEAKQRRRQHTIADSKQKQSEDNG